MSYVSNGYAYSGAGLDMINRLNLERRRADLAAEREASRRRFEATKDDFAEYYAKHQHSAPEMADESVFEGMTKIVHTVSQGEGYYRELDKEVTLSWLSKLADAKQKASLPEGHPHKLDVSVEKIH